MTVYTHGTRSMTRVSDCVYISPSLPGPPQPVDTKLPGDCLFLVVLVGFSQEPLFTLVGVAPSSAKNNILFCYPVKYLKIKVSNNLYENLTISPRI